MKQVNLINSIKWIFKITTINSLNKIYPNKPINLNNKYQVITSKYLFINLLGIIVNLMYAISQKTPNIS